MHDINRSRPFIIAGGRLFACMGATYTYRISVEEAALVAALGEPYKEYMRRTRRLIPFLF